MRLRITHMLAGFGVAVALLVAPVPALARVATQGTAAPRAASMVVVQLAGGQDAAAVERELESRGAVVTDSSRSGAMLVVVPAGMSRADFAEEADDVSGVRFAQPSTTVRAFGDTNDPRFGSQWGLTDIGAPTAWPVSEGFGVAVAVIDTGVDNTHPDLAGQVVLYKNYVDPGASARDDNGHGTHVAGIIAATRNNSIAGVGAAPKAKIYAFKVLDAAGNGSDYYVAQAIRDAVDRTPARIISMSLGAESAGGSPVLASAVAYARSKGAIVIAASGNSGVTNATYPAAISGVVGVGAVDSSNRLASFSNYGATNLDVVAPGVNVLSTYTGGGMQYMSGTSMATPFVSAAAAVLWSAYPRLTADQVIAALQNTATDLGTSGRDSYYGYGLIRIDAALRSLVPADPEPSTGTTASPIAPTPAATMTPAPLPSDAPTVVVPAPVSTRITLAQSRTSVARYRTVRFSGSLLPGEAGRAVRVYVMRPGSSTWTRVATVKTTTLTDAGGARYSYSFKPGRRGTYRVRVRFLGTDSLAASTSRALSLRVY